MACPSSQSCTSASRYTCLPEEGVNGEARASGQGRDDDGRPGGRPGPLVVARGVDLVAPSPGAVRGGVVHVRGAELGGPRRARPRALIPARRPIRGSRTLGARTTPPHCAAARPEPGHGPGPAAPAAARLMKSRRDVARVAQSPLRCPFVIADGGRGSSQGARARGVEVGPRFGRRPFIRRTRENCSGLRSSERGARPRQALEGALDAPRASFSRPP